MPSERMPAVRAVDNEPVYSARQPWVHAVDVRFTDVQAEDLLQHYVVRARGVDGTGRVTVQGAALQHSAIPWHGPRAGEQELTVIN
jgi:hypothetical protein